MRSSGYGIGLLAGLLLLLTAFSLLGGEQRQRAAVTNPAEDSKTAEKGEKACLAVSEKKKIALTFDDGPHPVYTQEMLRILEKHQIPATFFLLGEQAEKYKDLVKEIADKDHLIGNHTYHHVQITTLPAKQAYKEINETSELIKEVTGQGTEYVRPPFGTWNEGLESEMNLIPVMWTIDTLDWTTGNVDWIVNRVVKNAKENDIILMHDSYKSTVQAVDRIIPLLEADGFEFVTVDQVIMD